MIRSLLRATLFAWLLQLPLLGGELYYTGFDAFTTGFDTIVGKDGWTGSSSHTGLKLSGIDAESTHGVAGIGNAAFIGGNSTVLAPSVSKTVNVRKAITIDPVALGEEVVLLRVNAGIKDSTTATITRRDNFEFAFYNQSSQLLAFIQFDNSTIDSTTQLPAQTVWRSTYDSTIPGLTKVSTGGVFYYDLLMELVVRINYRTNRWSASLDGVDLFTDEVFYSGPNTKNLGVVAAQMQITATAMNAVTHIVGPAPGDNYMLFDDFGVHADPVPDPAILTFARDPQTGIIQLTWLSEALYKYQVEYTDDPALPWKSDLSASLITPADTGASPVFTDTSAAGKSRRFYRIRRSLP
jgi:hypothetical protein